MTDQPAKVRPKARTVAKTTDKKTRTTPHPHKDRRATTDDRINDLFETFELKLEPLDIDLDPIEIVPATDDFFKFDFDNLDDLLSFDSLSALDSIEYEDILTPFEFVTDQMDIDPVLVNEGIRELEKLTHVRRRSKR